MVPRTDTNSKSQQSLSEYIEKPLAWVHLEFVSHFDVSLVFSVLSYDW